MSKNINSLVLKSYDLFSVRFLQVGFVTKTLIYLRFIFARGEECLNVSPLWATTMTGEWTYLLVLILYNRTTTTHIRREDVQRYRICMYLTVYSAIISEYQTIDLLIITKFSSNIDNCPSQKILYSIKH